jgi:hypothetical protein
MLESSNETAAREYQRLCALIGGKPPYGDCQLVALIVSKAIPDSQIVKGIVSCDSPQEPLHQHREIEHFWVVFNGVDLDPLAQDWIGNPQILSRTVEQTVEPSEILDEYKRFIAEFPEPSELELFPLRWQVKDELIR